MGRAAPAVLARRTDALHVRVVASKAHRIGGGRQAAGVPHAKAEELLEENDRMRDGTIEQYYQRDWHDAANYHMVLNTEALGMQGAADVIVDRARRLGW